MGQTWSRYTSLWRGFRTRSTWYKRFPLFWIRLNVSKRYLTSKEIANWSKYLHLTNSEKSVFSTVFHFSTYFCRTFCHTRKNHRVPFSFRNKVTMHLFDLATQFYNSSSCFTTFVQLQSRPTITLKPCVSTIAKHRLHWKWIFTYSPIRRWKLLWLLFSLHFLRSVNCTFLSSVRKGYKFACNSSRR